MAGGAFGDNKPRFRVEVVLVRNRLVVAAVPGFPVVRLGVWVLNLLVRAVDQKPSPCEVGGETERPSDALLKHTLDSEWVLAVVREVLVREHGGHEVDDSIHVGGFSFLDNS